jgi:hypothetical protein
VLDRAGGLARSALDWLMTSPDGSVRLLTDTGIVWHGRIMTAVWLMLVPVAVVVARFYKVTPRQDWPRVLDNPFWFIWHRRLGYLAASLTLLAMGSIMLRKDARFDGAFVHAVAGWSVIAFVLFQVANALLRGTHGGPVDPFTRAKRPPEQWAGDHYCMTRRRIVFEYTHKLAGYVVLPAALTAIVSGLAMVHAPRWMWLGLVVICVVLVFVFVWLQRKGRCLDTYQAIWGTDPALPGNRRTRPIGWGIRRAAAADRAHKPPAEQG